MLGASLFAALAFGAVQAHDQISLGQGVSTIPYRTTSNLSDIDIETSDLFSSPSTFGHVDYSNCYAKDASIAPYDIAFVGAPFDTGVSARPGARFGPDGIRQGSYRLGAEFSYDVLTGYNPFKSWAKIVDCGNVPMTPFDNRYALLQLEKGHRMVSGRKAASAEKNGQESVPRIITLGGDHTITLAALRSAYHHFGEVTVIHFDSHIDTWDPKVLGGGISDYSAVNHGKEAVEALSMNRSRQKLNSITGTFLHIAHEEGLISNSSIHAGIRAPVSRRKGDLRNDMRCGFEIVTARSIDKVGVEGIVEQLRERVKGNKVYVSVDIDVLDPAYAPATGTPEVGGWTTREFLAILEGLDGLHIVGADVVEVAPAYDGPGQITLLAASEVALMLMSLMVGREPQE